MNQTAATIHITEDAATGRSVWALFREWAHRQKNAIALRAPHRAITYGELDSAVETLASWLSQCGVMSGDRVAIIVGDSVRAVEHFLALAKLGAVYVPFDSTSPEPLIWRMLEIADASYIVLDPNSNLRLPAEITLIPPVPDHFHKEENLSPAEAGSAHPLYLMFTSGSTGDPKGVMVSHAGVIRLAKNATPVSICPSDNILQISSRAFDASTFEIWGALLNGASLTLVGPNFPIKAVGKVIADFQVSVVWFTARLFDMLVDHQLEDLAPLKIILFGGESHSFSHVERAFRELPNTVLIHGYGPTENTTFSTLHRVTETDIARGIIPIGKPLDGSTSYVLDATSLLPVEDGQHGTLFVGGTGLALGYTDAVLTEERFIRHPQLAERIYNTGDTVYQNPEGELIFVGRQDRQVKIRGYRVELDEVEWALKEHPKVSAAIVLHNEVFHSNELFAFYQTHDHCLIEKEELVRFLSEKIAEFSIPSQFSYAPQLPLKSTGKVDTKRLVAEFQSQHRQVKKEGFSNPLVEIWERLLNLNGIDENTHFFEAGGDSLSALNLLLEVEDLFNISLPNDFLANHPRFCDFTHHLFQAKSTKGLFTFSKGSSDHIVYFVPWLQGSAYTYAQLARFLSIEGSVLSFNGVDADGKLIPYSSIEELAEAYCLTADLTPGTAVSLCGSSAGGAVALEIAYQLENRGIPVRNVIMLDTPEANFYMKSFNLWPTLIRNYGKLLNAQKVISKIRRLLRLPWFGSSPPPKANRLDPALWDAEWIDQHYKEIMGKYQTRVPTAATIYLLRATQQDLDRSWSKSRDYGWRRVIPDIRVLDVNGGHASMLELGYVEALADSVSQLLRKDPRPKHNPTKASESRQR